MKPRPICPKCSCRRFRNVGSFGHYAEAGKFYTECEFVECMRCGEMWDRLREAKR